MPVLRDHLTTMYVLIATHFGVGSALVVFFTMWRIFDTFNRKSWYLVRVRAFMFNESIIIHRHGLSRIAKAASQALCLATVLYCALPATSQYNPKKRFCPIGLMARLVGMSYSITCLTLIRNMKDDNACIGWSATTLYAYFEKRYKSPCIRGFLSAISLTLSVAFVTSNVSCTSKLLGEILHIDQVVLSNICLMVPVLGCMIGGLPCITILCALQAVAVLIGSMLMFSLHASHMGKTSVKFSMDIYDKDGFIAYLFGWLVIYAGMFVSQPLYLIFRCVNTYQRATVIGSLGVAASVNGFFMFNTYPITSRDKHHHEDGSDLHTHASEDVLIAVALLSTMQPVSLHIYSAGLQLVEDLSRTFCHLPVIHAEYIQLCRAAWLLVGVACSLLACNYAPLYVTADVRYTLHAVSLALCAPLAAILLISTMMINVNKWDAMFIYAVGAVLTIYLYSRTGLVFHDIKPQSMSSMSTNTTMTATPDTNSSTAFMGNIGVSLVVLAMLMLGLVLNIVRAPPCEIEEELYFGCALRLKAAFMRRHARHHVVEPNWTPPAPESTLNEIS